MGCRILYDERHDLACLYCSTSDVAFGPVFSNGTVESGHHHDAEERAEAFLRYLNTDPRRCEDDELMLKYGAWLAQEAEQWTREEQAEERED